MEDQIQLPEKLFFKIGEVAHIVGTEPHVLRYWEKEFAVVRPRKSRGGQRLYRRNDVEALLRIKRLLREEGYTVSGAKKKLAAERSRVRQGLSDTGPEEQAAPAPLVAEPSAPAPAVVVAAEQQAGTEQNQELLAQVERLKEECQGLRHARALKSRRLEGCEEALRHVRRELTELLADAERVARFSS